MANDPSPYIGVWNDIQTRLTKLNEIDTIAGCGPLEDRDLSFHERSVEIADKAYKLECWARENDLESMDLLLDTMGAHLVAFKVAILRERLTNELEEAA